MKFLILFLSTATLSHAEGLKVIYGGTVEKGGNSAYCFRYEMGEAPPEGTGIHPPEGLYGADYYMLDYAHAMQEGHKRSEFAAIKNWEESRQRMEKILRAASPRLLSTFQDFADSADHPGASRSLHRSWKETDTYRLIDNEPGYAPPSCLAVLQQSIAPEVQQAIVTVRGYLRAVTRQRTGKEVVYLYHAAMLSYLEAHAPLQHSLLLTHEWLWDHTNRLSVNQNVNVFLHSEAAEGMTGSQIRARLRQLGLRF